MWFRGGAAGSGTAGGLGEGEGGQVEDESQTGSPKGRGSQKISGVEAKDNSVTLYSFIP